MRILLVKTSSLGDVIHNLPVVSDLRRAVSRVRNRLVRRGSLLPRFRAVASGRSATSFRSPSGAGARALGNADTWKTNRGFRRRIGTGVTTPSSTPKA
jgi:hypothetical protein